MNRVQLQKICEQQAKLWALHSVGNTLALAVVRCARENAITNTKAARIDEVGFLVALASPVIEYSMRLREISKHGDGSSAPRRKGECQLCMRKRLVFKEDGLLLCDSCAVNMWGVARRKLLEAPEIAVPEQQMDDWKCSAVVKTNALSVISRKIWLLTYSIEERRTLYAARRQRVRESLACMTLALLGVMGAHHV